MDTAGDRSQAGADSLRDGPVPPDIVIAPAHPAHERTEIVFEVRPGTDGTDVLPVFISVRHLVAAFGEAQPWLALPLRTVRCRQVRGAGSTPILRRSIGASTDRWLPIGCPGNPAGGKVGQRWLPGRHVGPGVGCEHVPQ